MKPLNIKVERVLSNVVVYTLQTDPLHQEGYMFRTLHLGKLLTGNLDRPQFFRSKKESTRHRTWVSQASHPVEWDKVPPHVLELVKYFAG